MAGEGGDNFSIVNALIYIGSGIAVTVAALIGGRKKGGETVDEREVRLAAVEKELAADRALRVRERAESEMAAMRADIEQNLQQVMAAERAPIMKKLDGFEQQIAAIIRQLASQRAQIARLSRKQPQQK